MKAPVCRMCQQTVLELDGQFEVLDSYYLDDPSPLSESWGEWHVSCLRIAPHRRGWYEVRLQNHLQVRRYEKIAEAGDWTVIKNPRTSEVLAFSTNGASLDLTVRGERLRRINGGSVYAHHAEQFHLELEDIEAIRVIQERLTASKTFPVLSAYEALGILDRVVYPEALEGSNFHWKRGLAAQWTRNTVSMQCDYGFFVPAELEQYTNRAKAARR